MHESSKMLMREKAPNTKKGIKIECYPIDKIAWECHVNAIKYGNQ